MRDPGADFSSVQVPHVEAAGTAASEYEAGLAGRKGYPVEELEAEHVFRRLVLLSDAALQNRRLVNLPIVTTDGF